MKNKNSVLNVTILVVVAKLIAFLKEFVLSYYFGVSAVSDAYNIAHTIPITIIGFIAISLNTSYIPIYNRAISEKDEIEAQKFSNSLMKLISFISISTFLVIEIFATPLVRLFASGFEGETLALSVELTRYMATAVIFIAYNNLMAAFIQIKNKYYIVSLCDALLYIGSIIGIVGGYYFQTRLLAVGVLLGYVAQSVIYTVVAIKQNYRLNLRESLKNSYMKQLIALVLPVMVGSLAADINRVVDKTIASNCQTGAVSILSYSHKIDEAVIAIFVSSLVAISYPKLSKAASEKNDAKLKKQISDDIVYLLALTLPMLVGILLYANEIVRLLFVRGAFTKDNGVMVAIAFSIYACGMIPTAFRKYFVRIFYSFSDSKTPASNSLIVIAMNIILSIVLAQFWGLYGVAAGSSISITIGVVRLIMKSRKYVTIDFKEILLQVAKLVLAVAVMAVSSKVLEFILVDYFSHNLVTIVVVIFAVIVYGVMLLLLRMKHLLNYMRK